MFSLSEAEKALQSWDYLQAYGEARVRSHAKLLSSADGCSKYAKMQHEIDQLKKQLAIASQPSGAFPQIPAQEIALVRKSYSKSCSSNRCLGDVSLTGNEVDQLYKQYVQTQALCKWCPYNNIGILDLTIISYLC